MSKAKVQRKRPPLTSPLAGVPAELTDLLGQVETCCNRAAGIVNAAARAVAGDELTLNDDYVHPPSSRSRSNTPPRSGNARRSCLACPDGGVARLFPSRGRRVVARRKWPLSVDLGSLESRCQGERLTSSSQARSLNALRVRLWQ
jgi:hypothetical protein